MTTGTLPSHQFDHPNLGVQDVVQGGRWHRDGVRLIVGSRAIGKRVHSHGVERVVG